MAKEKKVEEIQIVDIRMDVARVCIIGRRPMIYNAISEKVRQELLFPGLKGRAARAGKLKHNPIEEFRNSTYKFRDKDGDMPTRLYVPTGMFKAALSNAALDVPGMRKAQIERLCWITGDTIPVYGVPQLFMATVRSADQNHTPDIRTRAIVPQWCCELEIQSAAPLITVNDVVKLLAVAGITCGIGDGRQQKGAFSYGQFALTSKDDPDFLSIKATGGRAEQDAALENPGMWDDQTEALYTWFNEELARRTSIRSVGSTSEEEEPEEGGEDASAA